MLNLLECLLTRTWKTDVTKKVASSVGKNIQDNSDYYSDFVKFNFLNSVPKTKSYKVLKYTDLPPKLVQYVEQLKKQLGFYRLTYEQQLKLLRLETCEIDIHNIFEAKYCFVYLKKYKTLEYSVTKSLTKEELLKPVNRRQFEDFV